MRGLAERDAMQRVGSRPRGQRADDAFAQRLDRGVERAGTLKTFCESQTAQPGRDATAASDGGLPHTGWIPIPAAGVTSACAASSTRVSEANTRGMFIMAASKLPGTDAARHGTGTANTGMMVVMHDAFRRDLVSLAHAADGAAQASPDQQRAVASGWEVFKRQLHAHHTAEDEFVWPALRTSYATSENALSVLDAMEDEHERVDPLLSAVDDAFARLRADGPGADDWPGVDRLADMVDVLVSTLIGHLDHEERDALPLISGGLTAEQWSGITRQMARRNGMAVGSEMFAWMLAEADPGTVRTVLGQLPPPLRLIYRAIWKPRYSRTPHW